MSIAQSIIDIVDDTLKENESEDKEMFERINK